MFNRDANCIVTFARLVNEEFPWNQLECVVEYDPLSGTATSELRKFCEKHGVNYVALQSVIPENVHLPAVYCNKIAESTVLGKARSTEINVCFFFKTSKTPSN